MLNKNWMKVFRGFKSQKNITKHSHYEKKSTDTHTHTEIGKQLSSNVKAGKCGLKY